MFLSVYKFDRRSAERDLIILDFESADKDWLNFVYSCRMGKPNHMDYDMVRGAVVDDTVYAAIQLFEMGLLDEEEKLKRLKIQKLYDQILFHTNRSLDYCHFVRVIEL